MGVSVAAPLKPETLNRLTLNPKGRTEYESNWNVLQAVGVIV